MGPFPLGGRDKIGFVVGGTGFEGAAEDWWRFGCGGGFAWVGVELTGLGLGDKLGDEFRLEAVELLPIWLLLLEPLILELSVISGTLPVLIPPLVFFSVGIPPAKRPPMPGKGPGN
jgi:hypothetical protein